MGFNPQKHHRRSIRLKGYDYSKAGAYFVTICTQNMKCLFGRIQNEEMKLNEFGTVAHEEWLKLTTRFINFELDVFQIMPNHMHAIIVLKDSTVGAGFTPAHPNEINIQTGLSSDIQTGLSSDNISGKNVIQSNASLVDIIGAYKSLVANVCLDIHKQKYSTQDCIGVGIGVNPMPYMGKLWQRNYYEHIIRDKRAYQNISNYIINNPVKWKGDKFYEN